MQAIERILTTSNDITFVLILLFFMLFILRMLDIQKLRSATFALFNISTINDEVENREGLTAFQVLFFCFNCILFTLTYFFFKIEYKQQFEAGFNDFLALLLVIFIFFALKRVIELLLLHLFNLKQGLHFYSSTKQETFNTFNLFHFVLLILFAFQNLSFALYLMILSILLFYRFLFIVLKNNKLIFSKLFYFILYLCALEIAPLLVLFKMTF